MYTYLYIYIDRYIYHISFHSSVNELSGCSHILATVKNTTRDTRVHIPFRQCFHVLQINTQNWDC